jgi:6-phosphogluconolactonase (cycloisomerase 2 family)
MEIHRHRDRYVRFSVIISRWVLLALGIAVGALNSGCGGAGGATGIGSRSLGSTSVLYLAGASGPGTIAQSTVLGASDAPLSPPMVSTGANPVAMVVSRDHRFAYVADASTNSIFQYAITSTGSLSPLSPTSVSIGSGSPTAIVEDGSGNYVYVADGASIVTMAEAPNGLLTKIGAFGSGQTMALATVGSLLFATWFTSSGNRLASYGVGPDGSLTLADSLALPSVSTWDGLAVSNDNVFVIQAGAGTGTGAILAYPYQLNGLMSETVSGLSGGNPSAAVVSASGHNLYVLDGAAIRTINAQGVNLVENSNVALPISTPFALVAPFTPMSPTNPLGATMLNSTSSLLYTAIDSALIVTPMANESVVNNSVAVTSTSGAATAAALFGR